MFCKSLGARELYVAWRLFDTGASYSTTPPVLAQKKPRQTPSLGPGFEPLSEQGRTRLVGECQLCAK
jgi:hypothetical protein